MNVASTQSVKSRASDIDSIAAVWQSVALQVHEANLRLKRVRHQVEHHQQTQSPLATERPNRAPKSPDHLTLCPGLKRWKFSPISDVPQGHFANAGVAPSFLGLLTLRPSSAPAGKS